MDSFEIDGAIHYLCFLYANPETGKTELSVVRNEKLEYHSPGDDDDASGEKSEKEEPTGPESQQ